MKVRARVMRRTKSSKKMMNQMKLNWKPWAPEYGVCRNMIQSMSDSMIENLLASLRNVY